MKKFAKLAAVLAALVLVLPCLVACSNGDDDSGSDSASVQALQGLWISEEGWGNYVVGDTMYEALFDKSNKKYYYNEDGDKFSVSGNKCIMHYYDGEYDFEFEIKGDTLTVKYYDEDDKKWSTNTYKKFTKTPIKMTSKEFDDLGNSLFADEGE